MKSLLSELLVPVQSPPTMFLDNLGATYLSANPVFYSHMKHLAIDYHFVHDLVLSSKLCVVHVSASNQLVDALTKSLSQPRLFPYVTRLVLFLAPILWGSIRVYLGFFLLSLCFYLFALALVYLYLNSLNNN